MFHRIFAFFLVSVFLLTIPSPAVAVQPQAKIDPGLLQAALVQGEVGFWVVLHSQADLSNIPGMNLARLERGNRVVAALKAASQNSQAALLKFLAAGRYSATPYWIINAIHVRGPAALIEQLSRRAEVANLLPEHSYHLIASQPGQYPAAASAFDNWGLEKTGAPQVWARYFNRGEGIVVATIDTGAQFDHPALVRQYRGSLPGGGFDHNYSWFNAIDDGNCPPGLPCDMEGHGTHVLGIMTGETADLVHQTGMAPGAKWIAARACTYTSCTDENLVRAAEWMLEPTDLNGR